jgi:hypothetical protein
MAEANLKPEKYRIQLGQIEHIVWAYRTSDRLKLPEHHRDLAQPSESGRSLFVVTLAPASDQVPPGLDLAHMSTHPEMGGGA